MGIEPMTPSLPTRLRCYESLTIDVCELADTASLPKPGPEGALLAEVVSKSAVAPQVLVLLCKIKLLSSRRIGASTVQNRCVVDRARDDVQLN